MKREPIWGPTLPPEPKLSFDEAMPWKHLSGLMRAHGLDQKHLARFLKRGITYVNLRLNGHALWSMEDALAMTEAFHIRPEHFLYYFGKDPVPFAAFHEKPAG